MQKVKFIFALEPHNMTQELKNVVDIIVRDFAPDKIILFGSRARGDFKKNSDYDLLVLKNDLKDSDSIEKKIYQRMVGTGVGVDVLVDTQSRFNTLSLNPYLIYKMIMKEGKTLYEKK